MIKIQENSVQILKIHFKYFKISFQNTYGLVRVFHYFVFLYTTSFF